MMIAAVCLRHRRIVSLLRHAAGVRSGAVACGSRLCESGDFASGATSLDPYVGEVNGFISHRSYSTGFTSIHGERPSAEYARLRKESLENQFGIKLGSHSSKNISSLYHFGPFLALYRAAIISFYVAKLAIRRLFVEDMQKRAVMFRDTLISLGPFYIKLGQALSTRADILPKVYCQELAKLQEAWQN